MQDMTLSAPFIALLRRAMHSGYKELIMNNRMFIQCYNLDIDSDIGMHYVLYVPDTPEYEDEFYDSQLIIEPREIINTYTVGHRQVDARRKEAGAKTKEITEEFVLKHDEIKFMFYFRDELVCTTKCGVKSSSDTTDVNVTNVERTYQNLLERVKVGGMCLLFDGLRLGIQAKATEASEIYFYPVKFGKKHVRIPFSRSTFMGIKDVDRFLFSVQESNIPDVFVYSVQLTKKKITEQMFGFLLAF